MPSYTFWYGTSPPIDLLSQFDRIVVEADNISDREIIQLKQHGGKVIAYLSLGETLAEKGIDPDWVIGQNTAWNSRIMDLSSLGWQKHLLKKAAHLITHGAQGFFLDTLDSYLLPGLSPEATQKQQQALATLVKLLKKNHPEALLVANRGFEVMQAIAPSLEAVAAESLYQGWDNAQKAYHPVKKEDSNWLKAILKNIQKEHGLDIVVLDYLPPEQRDAARETAHKIEQDGFIPWVANPSFNYMGIGLIETIPRKILMLYDSASEYVELVHTNVHRLATLPLEYMGYVPVYHDIQKGLPLGILKGRFCGVISWMDDQKNSSRLEQWFLARIKETTPIALLGGTAILSSRSLSRATGITPFAHIDVNSLQTVSQTDLIGFEADEPGRIESLSPLRIDATSANTSHLRMIDKNKQEVDLVVTGKWGGYVSEPAILDEDFQHNASWIIDPFAFLSTALALPAIPVPQVTTENGRRLFLIHVDGDGFMEKFETPGKGFAPEMLLENIFTRYKVPHTISIVEGEVGPTGLYPDLSTQLEPIARKIFSLDNVEVASHSYSHPFIWSAAGDSNKNKQYHLPIKNYTFSLEREISGSARYINTQLAPKEKQTKVFLWTGDCLPTEEALAEAEKAGLLSMNGGDTTITNEHASTTYIAGLSKPVGDILQVFAPNQNENVYTNDWTGPFYGYRRVIETFKLTDFPRRFKPINIYYHFYSGSKHASLKALQTVYDWAMTQETMPIYASDYIRKVQNYQQVGISRRSDGSWRITGLNELKSLRLDQNMGWPQDRGKKDIVGWRNLHDGIYLHAGTEAVAEFNLGKVEPASLNLRQANGRLVQWQPNSKGIHFRIQGNVPVMMEISGIGKNCTVAWEGGVLLPQKIPKNGATFHFQANDTGNAVLKCN